MLSYEQTNRGAIKKLLTSTMLVIIISWSLLSCCNATVSLCTVRRARNLTIGTRHSDVRHSLHNPSRVFENDTQLGSHIASASDDI
eukprot:IDg23875t1